MSNRQPIEIIIRKHHGKTGDYKVLVREYMGENLFTNDILGYYKTDSGAVQRAGKECQKWLNSREKFDVEITCLPNLEDLMQAHLELNKLEEVDINGE